MALRESVALAVASVAIILGTVPLPAKGVAQRRVPSLFDRCVSTGEALQGVMPAIEACYRAEIDRNDVELNTVYRAYLRKLAPAEARAFRAAERKWILRRDAKCIRESTEADGVGTQDANISYLGCLIIETIDRTEWIKHLKK